MSDTIKGSKGNGYEYWGKRPGNQDGGVFSKHGNRVNKRRTHKAERRQGKAATKEMA